jgi:hypothetical protein
MCVNDRGRWVAAKGFPVFARIRVGQGQSIRDSVLGKAMAVRKMPDEGSRRTRKVEFVMKRNAIKSFLLKTFH